MGNSLPLPSCACHHCCCGHDEVKNEVEEAGTAVSGSGSGSGSGGAKKRRRRRKQQQRPADRSISSRNVVRAARPRHVVVPVVDDAPEDGDGDSDGGRDYQREQQAAAWRPECRVEPAGHGEGGGVRVRIVMKRKDIPQLVARLEEQRGRGAEERNAAAAAAGMEEEEEEVSSTELAGCSGNDGGGGGGGSTMTSPCRDAWRPRLSIVPENY